MYAIIFDMDGVIFDSEKLVIDCWEAIAQKNGFENITEICMQTLGVNDDETKKIILDYYGEDFPYDEYQAEMARLYHERADHGKLPQKKGIKELLRFLKEKGAKVAVASSSRSVIVRQQLEDGGLLPYFDVIVGGEMVEKSKPEPDIFLYACDKLGISPADCYVIEDSFNGIRAAVAAGMKPIMVPDLLMPDEEMQELTLQILPDLMAVID